MVEADGIIVGSPVYYAGINGTLKSFLDRAFYASSSKFKYKVGASVIAQRRAGALPAFDQINKYFAISEMVTVGASYWNMAFGAGEGEALQDDEGMQNMRVLGKNVAWLIKTIKEGKVEKPETEKKIKMNFIR
ncbi:MAG: 2-amino-4-deoxychorismate dehydrogenase [Alphaproteobacteria bacterium ADurb.Bin438]|nr:MAG: 2-amino-4-deoxychorismate dehydrogenase [Alphaproteobacteria bacterium ADurb.Bin438]